jgi:hypothetical protein
MRKYAILIILLFPLFLFSYSVRSGDVSNQIWGPGTYYIEATASVAEGASLTILPGTVVKVNTWHSLRCSGTLVAVSEGDSIVFTSKNDNTAGEVIDGSDGNPNNSPWAGLIFTGSQAVPNLQRCSIRGYIQGYDAVNIQEAQSGFITNSRISGATANGIRMLSANLEISHNVIHNNGGNGILLSQNASSVIENNLISNNGAYAIAVDYGTVPSLVTNTAIGNHYNAINYYGVTVSSDVNLSANLVHVIYSMTVGLGATLNIEPGAICKLQYNGIEVYGTINAIGTSSNRVVFTSFKDDSHAGDTNADGGDSVPQANDWSRLSIQGANSAGYFEYCDIRYSYGMLYNECLEGYVKNSRIMNSGYEGLTFNYKAVDVQNTEIAYNGGSGIAFRYITDTSLLSISGNNIHHNGGYAIDMFGGKLFTLQNHTFNANAKNVVLFSNCYLGDNYTLNTQYKYVFNNLNIPVDTGLTVPAGSIVKLQAGAINVYGSLTALGTAIQPIVFTAYSDDAYGGDWNADGESTTPQAGAWERINYFGAAPQLEHCIIRFSMGLSLQTEALGYVRNCKIYYSSGSGITSYNPHELYSNVINSSSANGINIYNVSAGSSYLVANNSIHNASGYAIAFHNSDVYSTSGNTFSGNTYNLIYYFNCYVRGSMTMNNSQAVLINGITVPEGQTLSIEPGTLLKLISGNMQITGTLNATGTQENPIIFTSFKDDSKGGDWNGDADATSPANGDWGYLNHISATNAPQIEHCHFYYGGGISINSATRGYIRNCKIYNSGNMGIFLNNHPHDVTDNEIAYSNQAGLGTHGVYTTEAYEVSGNQISNCNSFAMQFFYSDMFPQEDNVFIDNLHNASYYNGSNLKGEHFWTSDYPMVVSNLNVTAEASLELAPGCVVKVQSGNLNIYGNLKILGTAMEPIYFTSWKDDSIGGDLNADGDASLPARGDWNYVLYTQGAGMPEVAYAHFRYGLLQLQSTSKGYVQNSSFAYSGGNGLELFYNPHDIVDNVFFSNVGSGLLMHSVAPNTSYEISGLNIYDNDEYAISAWYSNLYPLQDINVNNNRYNAIKLTSSQMVGEHVISNNPSYVFSGVTILADSILELLPGTILKCIGGTLAVQGELITIGTQAQPIVYTSWKDDSIGGDSNADADGTSPAPGDWGGIQYNSAVSTPQFEYCYVYYGQGSVFYPISGGYVRHSKFAYSGNNGLTIVNAAMDVEYSEFSYCLQNGLTFHNVLPSVPYQVQSNTFYGNLQYPLFFTSSNVFNLIGNTYLNNTHNAVRYDYCSVVGNMTINSGSVVVINNLSVNPGVTLELQPAAVLKMLSGGLNVNGRLLAIGNESSRIVFTSFKDDAFGGDTNADGLLSQPAPGDWATLQITGSYLGSQLRYCDILYSSGLVLTGNNASTLSRSKVLHTYGNGVYLHTTNYIHDNHIRYSTSNGVHVGYGDPELRRNYIMNNAGYGVYIQNGNPDLGMNFGHGFNFIRHNDNDGYQIYSQTNSNIYAIGNYWQWDDAESIDAHIWDNEESGSSYHVIFSLWGYPGLAKPVLNIESNSLGISISWAPIIYDDLLNPFASMQYRVEMATNPNAPDEEWQTYTITEDPFCNISEAALPNSAFFRVIAIPEY